MSWWRNLFSPKPPPHHFSVPSEADDNAALEPFKIEITDVLDLHAFAPRDIGLVVEAYLEEAQARGFSRVRIIHGKGIGVQREQVRAILRRTPFVLHYEEAPPEMGSWGATMAWLGPILADGPSTKETTNS